MVKFAPEKLAPVNFANSKLALERLAFLNDAYSKSVLDKSAPLRSALSKIAFFAYFSIIYFKNLKLPQKTLNDQKTKFNVSDYQKSERDFAFIVNKDVNAQDLVEAVSSVDQNLISNIKIFDVYEGQIFNITRGDLEQQLLLRAN